jgi:hypothetical protein
MKKSKNNESLELIQKEEFKKLYYRFGSKAMAKKFNVSVPTILKYVKECGLKVRKKGRPKKFNF